MGGSSGSRADASSPQAVSTEGFDPGRKWTPGPWLVGTGSGGGATTYVYEDDGTGQQCNAIAGCTLDFIRRSFAEREANARLIAAAPELYEALNDLLQTSDEDGHYHDLNVVAVDKAERALAKARGQ